MDLILWRHAHAEDLSLGRADGERMLTAKGRHQARDIARWLAQRLPADGRVIVSPAQRAQETAAALGTPFRTEEAIGTGAEGREVLETIQRSDAAFLVLVGHQPALGEVAAYLLAGRWLPWQVPKGAAWWLATDGRAGSASLMAAMNPKCL